MVVAWVLASACLTGHLAHLWKGAPAWLHLLGRPPVHAAMSALALVGQSLLALMPAVNAVHVCSPAARHARRLSSILALPPHALVQSCPVMQQSVLALGATAALEADSPTCSSLLSATLWLMCVVAPACNQAVFSMYCYPIIMASLHALL